MKSNSQKGEFVSRSRSFRVSQFQGFRVSGVLHFGDYPHNQDKKSSCTRRGEGGV